MPPRKRRGRPPQYLPPRRRTRAVRGLRIAAVPVTSDEFEEEHTVNNLPVPPGNAAIRELAIQQETISKLRAENARLSTVEDRLEALEHAATELARNTAEKREYAHRASYGLRRPCRFPRHPPRHLLVTRVGGHTGLLALPALT